MADKRSASNQSEYICLALYIVLLPLNIITISGAGSIYKSFMVGVVAILLLRALTRGHIKLLPEMIAWGVYVAYLGMSIIWSENPSRSITYFIGMLQIFVMVLLFVQKSYTANQYTVFKVAMLIVGAVFFVLQVRYSAKQAYTSRQILSFGDLGGVDPNEFCGYLLLPIAICMQYFFTGKSAVRRIAAVGAVLLLLFSVLSAGSRGGLLAVFTTIFYIGIKSNRFSAKKVMQILMLALAVILVCGYIILPNLPEKVIDRYSLDIVQEDGGSGRLDLWARTLKALWNEPLRLLFGCGIYGAKMVTHCSHNMLIQVLLDSGIMGMTLYIILLLKLIKAMKNKEIYIQAAFWGIQVSLLTLSAYAWFKAVWLIYMLCIVSIEPKEINRDNKKGVVINEKASIVM